MSDDEEAGSNKPEPVTQRKQSEDVDVDVVSIEQDEATPVAEHKQQEISPTTGNKRTPPQRAPSARNRARQAARQQAAIPPTSSKTVDSVIDSIARGKPLEAAPSWRKPKQSTYYDPALKAVHEQLELEGRKKQLLQLQQEALKKEQQQQRAQGGQQASPPQQNEQAAQHSQQYQHQMQSQQQRYQQHRQVQLELGHQEQLQETQQTLPQRIPQQRPQSHSRSPDETYSKIANPPRPQQPRSRTRLTHAPRMSASSHGNTSPRGLLPPPPGTVQQNSPDDHKFKKPMLPAKHRKVVIDEEKRRKEAQEDAERVQRHLEAAKRAVQEAAKVKAAQKASEPPRPQSKPRPQAPSRKKSFHSMYYTPAPSTPENYVSPEMKQQADAEKQKICLNQEFIEVPNVLVHSLYMLRSLMNKQNFYELSPESQQHLIRFLPQDAQTSQANLEESLNYAFTLDPYVVKGNPVNTFHLRLRNGYFNLEKMNELIALREAEKIEYEHYIRMYHMKLFKRLLVSRTLILQQYDTVHVGNIRRPGPQPLAKDVVADKQHMSALRRRAAKRSRMMMSDCRAKVGEQGLSSDEEGEDIGEPINKALQSTIFQKSTIYNNKLKDLDMWQPTKVDDVKQMLKKYKKFKKECPKAPSLDFRGIRLDHVFDRAGILAQSVKIRETVAALEKSLGRVNDPHGRLLFQ